MHYHFGFVKVRHSFGIFEVSKEGSGFKQYILLVCLALLKCLS